MPVSHPFVSVIADDPAAVAAGQVVPSNWNAAHTVNIDLGGSEVSGTTLKASVVNSSLTSVGTLVNLTVTNAIAGSVTGNAATVTTNANLTGPITSTGNATAIASQTGTGTKFVVDTSPTLVTPNIGTATGTGLILTSTAATAFVVGANGSTNPAFTVDASTASSATGVTIKSAAAGGGVALTASSSASSETMFIQAKAASNPSILQLSATSWLISQRVNMIAANNSNNLNFQVEGTGNPLTKFTFSASGNDSPFSFTENNWISVGSSTSTWGSAGTLANNRTIIIGRQTLIAPAGLGTITNAATMALTAGPPLAGNNMTLTNAHGIFIAAAAVTTGSGAVTNAYGLTVNAPSGGGSNYAAQFIGTTLTNDVKLVTAGNGLFVKEGSNAKMGQATLVAGTVTVSTTAVNANSRIFLTVATAGGVQGFLSYTQTNGTSFVINSTNVADTSVVNWLIMEAA